MGKVGWQVPTNREVGPSVRREDGVRDARTGRPKISNDRHYTIGYELGIRLRPESDTATEGTDKVRDR